MEDKATTHTATQETRALAHRQAARLGAYDADYLDSVLDDGRIPDQVSLFGVDTATGPQVAWLEGHDVVTRTAEGVEVKRDTDAMIRHPHLVLAAFAAGCAVRHHYLQEQSQ